MRLRRTPAALTAIALTAALLTPGVAAADVGQNQNTKAAADWGRISVQWDWSMPASMTDTDQYPGIPDEPMQPVPGYQAAGNALYGPLPQDGLFQVVLDAGATTISGGSKSRLQCTWTISTTPVTTYAGRPCSTRLTRCFRRAPSRPVGRQRHEDLRDEDRVEQHHGSQHTGEHSRGLVRIG